jgi:hypothetical protein
MRGRTKRLAIAVVLTTVDVATFNKCAGVIWQAWGQDPWAKAGLSGLLALWVSSAAVIWFHISNDFRDTLLERNRALSPAPGLVPREPRRDNDV